MKLFRKRRKLNNKGLSLVELVCAVAIFGLATTAIGGAMVVSAQNYSRGTYELDVQQEAQTTTNLIGDLLFDANGAKFDSAATNPVLVIQGEGIEYHITYDTTTKELKYEQFVGGTSATGILAQNVKSFSASNLDAAGTNFQTNKNVKIELEIEKNGRTYEAEYSTTARNGAAQSVGVAESAEIIIESEIVLEPRQTYLLPYEVVGSITDKSISISPGSGITVTQSGTNLSITVADTATGTIPFTVSTIQQSKNPDGTLTGLPLATKTVNVKVRRVNQVTSPMDADNDGIADNNALQSGDNYKNGASYLVEFGYVGDFMSKVYGKAYDMDYVNPKQLDISYTMTGIPDAMTNYISGVQIEGGENPYIRFDLIQDMPTGSEIIITATAKHPAGTNKKGLPYATVVDTVKIKYDQSLYPDATFMRGTDGTITCDSTMLGQIQNVAVAAGANMNYFYHLLTIYELDSYGNKIEIPACKQMVVGGGMNFQIDDEDSIRLDPLKSYVYKLEIMFYRNQDGSGNYIDPIWTVSPYSKEYPLDAIRFTYDYVEDDNIGTATNLYPMVAEQWDSTFTVNVKGLEMSDNKGCVIFTAEKSDGSGGWDSTTRFEWQNSSFTKNTGLATYQFMFRDPGIYRITASVNNYNYKDYDGVTNKTYTGPFVDGTGEFYVTVSPKP